MEKASYIVIESWMITELGLSGNSLLVYATIYGFTRDGVSVFFGNYDFLKKMTGISSSKTISTVLKCLSERNLIVKEERYALTGKSNGYKAVIHKNNESVIEDNAFKKEESKLFGNLANEQDSKKTYSYDDILNDFGVNDFLLRKAYIEFLRHCQLNGRTVTNDKLERLIVKLDLMYRKEDTLKVNALQEAIDKGYFDVKDMRIQGARE